MFSFLGSHGLQKALITGLIAFNSLSSYAELTSYNSNGVNLVYSSVSDVTWTKDANLLYSMFESEGYYGLIKKVIAASPTIKNLSKYEGPNGIYKITEADFVYNDVTWYGAIAFVNYLNSINYAGSNQWRLPSVTDADNCTDSFNGGSCGYNTAVNGTLPGNELSELYYNELNSKAYIDIEGNVNWHHDYGITDIKNKFDGEEYVWTYWTNSETRLFGTNYSRALAFEVGSGLQFPFYKRESSSILIMTPGIVGTLPIPEPDRLSMLLVGLVLISLAARRCINRNNKIVST